MVSVTAHGDAAVFTRNVYTPVVDAVRRARAQGGPSRTRHCPRRDLISPGERPTGVQLQRVTDKLSLQITYI